MVRSAREGITGEIYNHTGLGIFFTLLTLEWTLGEVGLWARANISWLQIVGLTLYIPSALLVFGSMVQLHHKGKSGAGDTLAPHGTAVVVDTGVYGIIRHPMWLGMSIWSVAIVLVFQSVLAVALAAVAIIFFRIGTIKEDQFNIREFGEAYIEYMKRVPAWNFLKRLRK